MRPLLLALLLAGCTAAEPSDPFVVTVDPVVEGQLTLLAVGDTDIGNAATDLLEREGPDYAFAGVDPLLDADLRLLNLETVPTAEVADPPLNKSIIHRMNPDWLDTLSERSFDVVSLANNHGMDQKAAGLLDAIDHIRERDIDAIGAGEDEAEARHAVIVQGGPLTLGLIALFEDRPSYSPLHWYASHGSAGVARWDAAALERDVAALHEQVDYVILFVHWGANYVQESEDQREMAAEAAAAGVDLVLGHGAHLSQGVELIDGVPVVYSLGNFVFGSHGRYGDMSPDMRLSALGRLLFDADGLAHIDLLPLRADNSQVQYQPQPADASQAEVLAPLLERYGMSWSWDDAGWYRWDAR